MPALDEYFYDIWLYGRTIGTVYQRDTHASLQFHGDYVNDPERPVLGLFFEEDLTRRYAANLRLPPWLSNLLPEGRLREWIADSYHISVQREMDLLAQVGHDLPGAVRIELSEGGGRDASGFALRQHEDRPPPAGSDPRWHFSLAGVGMKISMLKQGSRLTVPASGEGGNWIVKFPDARFPGVPHNEFAMMRLAASCGIDVPEIRLVHRDELDEIPGSFWPDREEWAYAIERFDRGPAGELIHIEDMAQVRNLYPDDKYVGNYETVAALYYRRHDLDSLREFIRRLTFCVLISNDDAHLKNWSLIYRNPRVPQISPAYDLVATSLYQDRPAKAELALKLGGTRNFDAVSLDHFARVEERIGARGANLRDAAAEVVERVKREWPASAESLAGHDTLRQHLDQLVRLRSRTLLAPMRRR